MIFFIIVGLVFIVVVLGVFNNVIDCDIDGIMERIKNRLMMIGKIFGKWVLMVVFVLGVVGIIMLFMIIW